VDNYRLALGDKEYVPIMVGGMGVDISTDRLALEACRLGGIGHVSDAMSTHVADKKFKTKYTKSKANQNRDSRDSEDKTGVKFNLEELRESQIQVISDVMTRKQGDGLVFVNVMEKLNMGSPSDTLQTRMIGALDAGIDGITLSAGLHNGSLKLIADHPRFRDAKIGIIVSSVRALKIFLRRASKLKRMPDYVIVEGPLAGGHLGFGEDWREYELTNIVVEVLAFMKEEELNIPGIPAGGIFTGTDAAEMLALGAGAVQVATRFTVTEECGLPAKVKQEYFAADEEDVIVSQVSATGYPIRLLTSSPCLGSNIKPQCEPFGYTLAGDGTCKYLDAYHATGFDDKGKKLPVTDKICICYHFSKYNVYTCGHYVYRLKDTSYKLPDGSYALLKAADVFRDYQFSKNHEINIPKPEAEVAAG
ncbi:MAG: nitronate monooxygenase, partial [Gammaproteobacteria bacterium]